MLPNVENAIPRERARRRYRESQQANLSSGYFYMHTDVHTCGGWLCLMWILPRSRLKISCIHHLFKSDWRRYRMSFQEIWAAICIYFISLRAGKTESICPFFPSFLTKKIPAGINLHAFHVLQPLLPRIAFALQHLSSQFKSQHQAKPNQLKPKLLGWIVGGLLLHIFDWLAISMKFELEIAHPNCAMSKCEYGEKKEHSPTKNESKLEVMQCISINWTTTEK